MRPSAFLILTLPLAMSVGACSASWTHSDTLPTLTVSGPKAETMAYVQAQISRHPELLITRALGDSPDRVLVTLALPDSVSGDERQEMARAAIAARLSTELKS